MFLPQVAEDDQFDKNGTQINDINTLSEFVDQVVLGHTSKKPTDEDDDNGQNFHVAKTIQYFLPQYINLSEENFSEKSKIVFAPYIPAKANLVFLDISIPPPKQLPS